MTDSCYFLDSLLPWWAVVLCEFRFRSWLYRDIAFFRTNGRMELKCMKEQSKEKPFWWDERLRGHTVGTRTLAGLPTHILWAESGSEYAARPSSRDREDCRMPKGALRAKPRLYREVTSLRTELQQPNGTFCLFGKKENELKHNKNINNIARCGEKWTHTQKRSLYEGQVLSLSNCYF